MPSTAPIAFAHLLHHQAPIPLPLQGALAPVFASISLFGLYLLLKYFPDLSIQTVLNAYFFLLGNFAIMGAGGPLLRQVCGPLGQTSIKLDVPEGWLVEEDGSSMTKVCNRARCAPLMLKPFGMSLHVLVRHAWCD